MSQNENRTRKAGEHRKRVHARLGLLLGLAALLVVQYQNCTPTEMKMSAASKLDDSLLQREEPSLVTVIDDNKADSKVTFPETLVQVHSQVRTLEVTGDCSINQDGATLGWNLIDVATQSELAKGFVFCDAGHFTVDLMATDNLECGHEYKVTARLGMGEAGAVTIERRCEPLETRDASIMKTQLNLADSYSCQIERRDNSCTAVCYDPQGVVASEQEVDPASCQ